MKALTVSLCALVALATALHADPQSISPEEARQYVGRIVTVRGTVADARVAATLNGKPTILCLDKPYGSRIFCVVIFMKDRPKFSFAPEREYKNRVIRVTGRVQVRAGIPEIVVTDPSQIGVEELGTEDRG